MILMRNPKPCLVAAALMAFAITATGVARAETTKNVRFALQWGLAWMPYVVMKREKIIERRAKEAGLGDVTAEYREFAGGNIMNDALLAGQIEFATTGITNFLVLWDKARKVLPVKAASGFATIPYALVTHNPNLKTMADISAKDRIALPAVKISAQAILLQMIATKMYGKENYTKFDDLTISRSMPDGMAAMLSGSEINSHFSSPPYLQAELRDPNVRTVIKTSDIIDVPISNGLLYTTEKFHNENPKLYNVVLDSLQEAIDIINKDKLQASKDYLDLTKEKATPEELVAILSEAGSEFTMTPSAIYVFAEFMHKVGTIKELPPSWKDFFFPEIHDRPGK